MIDDLLEVFVMVALVIALVALAIGGTAISTSYLSCRGFANGTGIETRWEWGCYAKVDGKWVPSQYVFGAANEVRLKGKP